MVLTTSTKYYVVETLVLCRIDSARHLLKKAHPVSSYLVLRFNILAILEGRRTNPIELVPLRENCAIDFDLIQVSLSHQKIDDESTYHEVVFTASKSRTLTVGTQ